MVKASYLRCVVLLKKYAVEIAHSLLGIIIAVSNASDFCILVSPAYHF